MNSRTTIAVMAITISLLGSSAQAVTRSVPLQYSTIRAALDAAVSGDVVEIDPGTYVEFGLIMPAGVTIAGTGAAPNEVLIEGDGQGRILLLESLSVPATIRNLTFSNGHAKGLSSYDQSGGAILISNSTARIENCIFGTNRADSHGGAIRCTNSSPEIVACQFYVNLAPFGGGGALDLSYNSSPLVTDCLFKANRAEWGGAVSCRGGSSPRIENGQLVGNFAEGNRGLGGGVFADNMSHPDLLLTTIWDNQARFGGAVGSYHGGSVNLDYCTVVNNKALILEGGILIVESAPFITGSIVAFNQGLGIAVSGDPLPQITCTDIYGNSLGDWSNRIRDLISMGGNLSVDPQFCSPSLDEDTRFHLTSTSPLAQAGSACGILGAQPVSCTGDKALVQTSVPTAAISGVTAAPNPFNPQTTISFDLEQTQEIRVSIYGVDGRLVQILGEGMFEIGAHELVWNGRDRSGRQVSSGTYFVMVKGRQDTQRLKVTMLK